MTAVLNYDHVFNMCSKPKPCHDVIKPNKNDEKYVEKQHASLSYSMETKAKKKPYKLSNMKTIEFTLSDADILATKEADKFVTNKKWDKLGVWFQWSLINSYLQEVGNSFNNKELESVKSAFKLKVLENIEYDNKNKKILKLNFKVGDIVV